MLNQYLNNRQDSHPTFQSQLLPVWIKSFRGQNRSETVWLLVVEESLCLKERYIFCVGFYKTYFFSYTLFFFSIEEWTPSSRNENSTAVTRWGNPPCHILVKTKYKIQTMKYVLAFISLKGSQQTASLTHTEVGCGWGCVSTFSSSQNIVLFWIKGFSNKGFSNFN